MVESSYAYLSRLYSTPNDLSFYPFKQRAFSTLSYYKILPRLCLWKAKTNIFNLSLKVIVVTLSAPRRLDSWNIKKKHWINSYTRNKIINESWTLKNAGQLVLDIPMIVQEVSQTSLWAERATLGASTARDDTKRVGRYIIATSKCHRGLMLLQAEDIGGNWVTTSTPTSWWARLLVSIRIRCLSIVSAHLQIQMHERMLDFTTDVYSSIESHNVQA